MLTYSSISFHGLKISTNQLFFPVLETKFTESTPSSVLLWPGPLHNQAFLCSPLPVFSRGVYTLQLWCSCNASHGFKLQPCLVTSEQCVLHTGPLSAEHPAGEPLLTTFDVPMGHVSLTSTVLPQPSATISSNAGPDGPLVSPFPSHPTYQIFLERLVTLVKGS